MTKFRTARPSPAMIVAILALSMSLVGTAVAAGVFSKQEKKVIKKLANKQITKRAPGLSVEKAKTANTATNANQANTAANAGALSGNTVVGEGDLDGPGLVTNSSCTSVSEPVPGAQAGDHVVLTPPSGWPTYEINLTARVTADTVTYEICNQSGAMANFGTSPPLRFLVFR
jgi:hypothetical protein